MQATVVRHIPVNVLRQRVDAPLAENIPISRVMVGMKVRYRCQKWALVQKRHLGRGWFQMTLKRGMGDAEQEISFKGNKKMTLEVIF